MENNLTIATKIVIAIGVTSLSGYFGILLNINYFKYISVIAQALSIIWSIKVIWHYKIFINWGFSFPIIIIISLYPLLRIIFESISFSNLKAFTDGFIVYGGYYQLVISGYALALLVLLAKEKIGNEILFTYSFFAIPISIVILIFIFKTSINITGASYLVISNCFIPLSLLSLYPSSKKSIIIGWVAIVLLFIISAKVSSRSYTIVSIFITINGLISLVRFRKRNIALLLFTVMLLFYFSAGLNPIKQISDNKRTNIVDKFQIKSLSKSFNNFSESGDLMDLYNWEGNSRKGILLDAFKNFDLNRWLFGIGIFGTYASFVKRSTIEIGWAQDTLRWGLPYVLFFILITILSIKSLKRIKLKTSDHIFYVLSIIVLIRLIDGFIFGALETSVYNLVFFWGIMSQGVLIQDKNIS
jgi:hypothetical protein